MDVDQIPHSSMDQAEEDDWLADETPYQPHPSSSASAGPSSSTHSSQPQQVETSDREWVTMNERYTNDGYREGITAGKLSTLQSGFDSGYLLSSVPARRLGALRGQASSLLALLLLPPPRATAPSRAQKAAFLPPLTLSVDERASLVEEARELVRDLGRIRMLDVVGRDLEAEEHARSHGEVEEGGKGQMEWQEGERKEMDELEQMMEGISGADSEKKKNEAGVLDLGIVEQRLQDLTAKVAGGINKQPIAM